jgi:hypothetical protein
MTNEEMERAVNFLFKSQANFEARLERSETSFNTRFELTNQQLAETNRHLAQFADIQNDMIRVMTRTFEAQAQINESVKVALARLAESQARTDRRLEELIDIVRRERNGE